jgi:glycosyltransferase involved in cell wall biosynthesis
MLLNAVPYIQGQSVFGYEHVGQYRGDSPMIVFLIALSQSEYVCQLAHGLSRKDIVNVAFFDTEAKNLLKNYGKFFSESKFARVLIPRPPALSLRSIQSGWELFKKIRLKQTEVIHVQVGCQHSSLLIALMLARISKIAVVTTVHDTNIHSGEIVTAKRRISGIILMALTDLFIVHGHILAKELENGGIDSRRIKVVPHGNYNIYHYTEGAIEPKKAEEKRILLFGRMFHYKGLDVLIRAARIVAASMPDVRCVFAGCGPELDRLLPEIEADPLFEIHNRYIEPKNVKTFFTNANVVVLPYYNATQSGPLNLAFSFGRPVIATRVGALPEAMNHGVEGLLMPPDDPEAFAGAILKVLGDPKLENSMGKAALNRSVTDLEWSGNIAQLTRNCYQKAVVWKKSGEKIKAFHFFKILKRLKRAFT